MSEFEDLGPKSPERLCCLGVRVSINLEAVDARRLENCRQKFLPHRARQVRQHSIRIGVGFEDPAPPAIAAQTPIVAEGTRFLLAARNHRLRNASKSSNFPSVIVRSTVKRTVCLIMLNSSSVARRLIVLSASFFDVVGRSISSGWPPSHQQG